jgi:hypothetical protein
MKLLRSLLCALALVSAAVAAPAAWAAVPSIHDVYTAATTGHLAQARAELDQVLAAYPNSAKAHYVSARVAAMQGNWSMAAAELSRAQSLDPGLSFEHRNTLQAFTRQVAAHTGGAAPAPAPRHGLPLGGIGIGLAVLALLILWAVYRASRRPAVQVMPQAWPAGPGQAGYPGYPQQPAAPTPYGAYPPAAPGAQPGSGLMGAVGTGLAMGAGVAAGEMLVDKLFDRGGAVRGPGLDANAAPMPPIDDAGPLPDDQDFGISDPGSWTDDGSGSDTWN